MPPIAPRPFVQLARRCWRLRIDVPRGYLGGVCNAPWYHARRRRSRFTPNRTLMRHSCERRTWLKRMRDRRPPPFLRTKLPPVLYVAAEVA